MIWLVRDPEGRVIGASVTPAGAVRDVKSHCGATTGAAMNELSQVVYADPNANSFEWAGYTLTREPLPAPAGTAGVGADAEVLAKADALYGWYRGEDGRHVSIARLLYPLYRACEERRAALAASTRTAGGDHA